MVYLRDSPMSSGAEDPDEGPGDRPRERAAGGELAAAVERGTEAVRSVQKSIDEAATAIRSFREMLAPMVPLLRSLGVLEDAFRGFAVEAPQAQPAPETAAEIAPAPTARPPPAAEDDIAPAPAAQPPPATADEDTAPPP